MSTDTENQLSKAIVKHGIDILNRSQADPQHIERYLMRIFEEKLNYPIPSKDIDKTQWFISQDFRDLDIEEYILSQCPKENIERAYIELDQYKKRNLIPLLKQMKYIVDTLREHNIVWGVGRGSSVASYVLFLLGVHKIDSIKYNLPLEEFFKEIKNG